MLIFDFKEEGAHKPSKKVNASNPGRIGPGTKTTKGGRLLKPPTRFDSEVPLHCKKYDDDEIFAGLVWHTDIFAQFSWDLIALISGRYIEGKISSFYCLSTFKYKEKLRAISKLRTKTKTDSVK